MKAQDKTRMYILQYKLKKNNEKLEKLNNDLLELEKQKLELLNDNKKIKKEIIAILGGKEPENKIIGEM